jgi:hypothetical protein
VSQPQPTPTPTTAPPTPGFLVASPQVQTVAAISDAHTYLSNTGGSPLNWRTEGFENRTPDCPSAAPSPTSGVLQPGQQVTIGYSGACPTVPQQPTCLRIHWIADATGQELQTLICGTG